MLATTWVQIIKAVLLMSGSIFLSILVMKHFGFSFSAFFEFIEWWAAVLLGGDADAYLATQGDIWDTQWDMFLALCGAIIAQLTLARIHDRQLGVRQA